MRAFAPVGLAAALLVTIPAWAGPTQSSFTPTGYKYPISSISIAQADGSHGKALYTCPGATAADCLVDLTDTTALQALAAQAQDVELDDGDYTQLVLSSCPAGTTGLDTATIYVKGSVTLGTDTFVTDDATGGGGMSSATTPEFAGVSLGCGGAVVKLLQPVTIAAGTTQTLTLLVDLTDVAWTDANVPNPGQGGCRSDGGAGQDLCTAFPGVVPYVGTGTPTFERYLVSHLAGTGTPALVDANAMVSFAIDAAGEVFYVLLQPFYTLTSPSEYDADKGGPDYNTSVRTFSKNVDGTIEFQSGGDVSDDRAGFTAFQRATHTGTCKNEEPASPTWHYQAFVRP